MPLSQGQFIADQGNAGALPWPVDVTNPVSVTTDPSGTATISQVPSATTSEVILAANANRKGATIFNDSTKILFLAAGPTAAAAAYTVQLATKAYYEVPYGYTGVISGIWQAVNGTAQVTEFT
jgi:hypothetical protein